MPMYEYRCRKCGQRFEMLRRMADADDDLGCPECQSDEVERCYPHFLRGDVVCRAPVDSLEGARRGRSGPQMTKHGTRSGLPSRHFLQIEVVVLQPVLERAQADSELLRGTGPIATILGQRIFDRPPLDISEQHRPCRPCARDREVVGLDHSIG